MNVGRNDPCPCGSGKKYKKCCLAGDEASARAAAADESALRAAMPLLDVAPPARRSGARPPASRPPDPFAAEVEAQWQEFNGTDYEGRIRLFIETLAEPDLMDGEMAFEMLNELNGQMAAKRDRGRLDELVEALREALPDVYAEERHWFACWRLENALADGRTDALPPLARELAEVAGAHIDEFSRVADQMAYYGQLDLLLEMHQLAWSEVKSSRNIVSWGIERFGQEIASLLIFDSMERQTTPSARDPKLIEQAEVYTTVDRDAVESYLTYLIGEPRRQWERADFVFAELRRRSEDWDGDEDDEEEEEESGRSSRRKRTPPVDPGRQNLSHLSSEFLGYLRREEKIPYPKGRLAQEEIFQYIQARFDGELGPRQSMIGAARGRKKPKSKPVPRQPDRLLCPDRETLDRHLANLMGFMASRPFRAAVMFELIPAWLRFLESRGLIDAELREDTVQQLQPIADELRTLWQREHADPALIRAMERWPADAGLAG